MACERFKQEFTKKGLLFQYSNWRSLLCFCWCNMPMSFWCRWGVAYYHSQIWGYMLGWFIRDLVATPSHMIRLSNWAYLILVVYLMASSIIGFVRMGLDYKKMRRCRVQQGQDSTAGGEAPAVETKEEPVDETIYTSGKEDDFEAWQPVPWDISLRWCLWSITVGMAPLVSVMYWCFYFPSAGIQTDVIDIHIHVVNVVVILVEIIVVNQPVRVLHFAWGAAYLLVYLIFSIIYYYTTGTAVYDFLDWSKPQTVPIALSMFLILFAFYLMMYGIYRARNYCVGKRNEKWEESQKATEANATNPQ